MQIEKLTDKEQLILDFLLMDIMEQDLMVIGIY